MILFFCLVFLQTGLMASSSNPPKTQQPSPSVWQKVGEKTADAAIYGVALAVGYLIYDIAKEGWRVCKGQESPDEKATRENEEFKEIELRKIRVKETESLIEKNNMIRQMCRDNLIDAGECKRMLDQMQKLINQDSEVRSLSYEIDKKKGEQSLKSMAGKVA